VDAVSDNCSGAASGARVTLEVVVVTFSSFDAVVLYDALVTCGHLALLTFRVFSCTLPLTSEQVCTA
jgi:hypothetical protein